VVHVCEPRIRDRPFALALPQRAHIGKVVSRGYVPEAM
jgi:hypothetical protein